MSDGPDSFDDVNAAVREEWKDETTPYERVREVISHTYDPASADAVADEALTSAKTARKHLETLAEDGFVDARPGDNGGTLYRRAPDSLIVEQAASLLEELSVGELEARVAEMRRELQSYQEQYDAQSPEELSVDLTNRALTDSADESEPNPAEISEWRTTRRNLAFANAALSIANARRFVDEEDAPQGVASAR